MVAKKRRADGTKKQKIGRECPLCGRAQSNLSTHMARTHGLYGQARKYWLNEEKLRRRLTVAAATLMAPSLLDNDQADDTSTQAPDDVDSEPMDMVKEEAMGNQIDLGDICDGNMLKLVTCHADALAVPREYIFLPLLVSVSAINGSSSITINPDWTEKCPIWCAIESKPNSKRTTVFNRISSALQNDANSGNDGRAEIEHWDDASPKEVLKNGLSGTKTKCLCLFEDFQNFASIPGMLEKDFLNSTAALKKTYDVCYNAASVSVAGFIPMHSCEELDEDIFARTLVSKPPQKGPTLSVQHKSPMPANTPCMKSVFSVLFAKHKDPVQYCLTNEATTKLVQFQDAMVQKIIALADHDVMAACYSKAAGQAARVACSMCCLRQALKFVVYREDINQGHWSNELSVEDISAGITFVEHVLEVKRSLMDRSTHKTKSECEEPTSASPRGTPSTIQGQAPSSTVTNDQPEASKRRRLEPEQPVPMTQQFYHTIFPRSSLQTAPQVILPPQQQGVVMQVAQPGPQEMYNMAMPPMPNLTPGQPNITMQRPPAPSVSPPADAKETPIRSYRGSMGSLHVDIQGTIHADLEKNVYFGNMTQEEFWRRYAGRIKRLLEWRVNRILPSTVAQRHLVPPLSKSTMDKISTSTRYPVAMCKEYLRKVCDLGFGKLENYITHNSSRRSLYFEKIPYCQITESAKHILNELQVAPVDYDASFHMHSPAERSESWGSPAQIGSPATPTSLVSAIDMPVFPQPQIAVVEQSADANDEAILVKSETGADHS